MRIAASRTGSVLGAAACLVFATSAWADDTPPPTLSLSARDTIDLWDNTTGGRERGAVVLNKLQVSGTVQGDVVGLEGFSVHAQVFRSDGSSLSRRVGDIQTVDSIDAVLVTRLFEAWVEKKIGNDDRSAALRVGLMDLNADFDSTQTGALFVNSSHGIGADLSRSGVDGPSIYPVSALAARLSFLLTNKWTLRIAGFNGVAGDPDRPEAFVAERLAAPDGALLIGQVDYHLTDSARIEAGLWHYTSRSSAIGVLVPRGSHDQGGYASIEGPIPGAKNWAAWARLGFASPDAQIIDRYVGFGVVRTGLFKGRKDDRIGLAVADAHIGAPARISLALPRAETSIETSYQLKIGTSFAAQPDVQYVIHPAAESSVRSALVVGLRLVFTAGFPKKAPATEAADPTVPPDGPQPPDTSPPSS
jgi:porin